MVDLVRFHEWLFDRNEIVFVEVKPEDGIQAKSDYDDKNHLVHVHLKNGKSFSLKCHSGYDAQKELDLLTINTNAKFIGDDYRHYLVKRADWNRGGIIELKNEVKKLMNSYKKLKDKEIKTNKSKKTNE